LQSSTLDPEQEVEKELEPFPKAEPSSTPPQGVAQLRRLEHFDWRPVEREIVDDGR